MCWFRRIPIMAQSDVNVSNLALRLMGSRVVLTAMADTTVEGVACNANLEDCRKSLLRMHPWNFATRRKVLQAYANIAVSNVTFVSSELIEVTHASTTYVAGNYVTLTGIQGATAANGTWEVASVPNGTTTRLTAIGITTSDLLGTYVASDADYIRRSPAFGFTYLFALPSDYIRILDVDPSSEEWKVEDGFILSNTDVLQIRYVWNVTDFTLMDTLFYQTLGHWFAYNLCDHITASDGKKNELHAYLFGGQGKRGVLSLTRFVDATESSLEEIEATDWTGARVSGPFFGP